jgi:hypothetical protein
MKQIIITAILSVSLAGSVLAQNENPVVPMKPFADWVGHWHGPSTIQMGPGQTGNSVVDERIAYQLDSTLIVVEGRGVRKDETTGQEKLVHHAFGVLSYNPFDKTYHFMTYLNTGISSDAWLKVTGNNKCQWGFDTPQRKFRYTIMLSANATHWNEVGESSSDGASWNKFFEMNLDKVN